MVFCDSSPKQTKTEDWYQEWGAAVIKPKNVVAGLELGDGGS